MKVQFFYERFSQDVFAFFPDENYDFNGYRNDLKTCYSHVGQHSACHLDYVKECKKAKEKDYIELKNELITIGYNNLEII